MVVWISTCFHWLQILFLCFHSICAQVWQNDVFSEIRSCPPSPLCFLHRVSLSVPLSSSSYSLDSCLHQPLSLSFSTFLTLSPTLSVPSLFFHLMLSSYFHKRCSYFNSLTTSYAFQGHWLIYPPLSRSMGSGRDFFYLLLWRLTFSLYPLYYTVPHYITHQHFFSNIFYKNKPIVIKVCTLFLK